jgi:acryloyl-coenzyme A reductase
MKAVTFAQAGAPPVLEYREIPDPVPTGNQVVVRVEACGVCGHDSADRAGLANLPLPAILGHEISGEIVEVGGAVQGYSPGDAVACKQFSTCGRCLPCRSGNELSCSQKRFTYGGGAEFVALEQDTLLKIPEGVSFDDAALTACAVGSCLQALDNVGRLQAGETVVITGAGGGLGLHGMQVASALGARVIALTSSPQKVALLREHGADEVVVSSGDFSDELLELTGGRGPEVVLDNVGHPDVFRGCFKALGVRGRYVLTGQLYRQKISLFPAFVFHKEAIITGSRSTLMSTFMKSMDLVASGKVHGVTERFALADAVSAHEAVDSGKVLGRAILIP